MLHAMQLARQFRKPITFCVASHFPTNYMPAVLKGSICAPQDIFVLMNVIDGCYRVYTFDSDRCVWTIKLKKVCRKYVPH